MQGYFVPPVPSHYYPSDPPPYPSGSASASASSRLTRSSTSVIPSGATSRPPLPVAVSSRPPPLSPDEEDDRSEGPWFTDEEVDNHPPVRNAESDIAAEKGHPTPHDVAVIVYEYIKSLTPKKREKVLFSHAMYLHITAVLRDPNDNTTKTANFRNWVRRTFTIQLFDHDEVLCHEHKPVAVREQVYEVLCHCHHQAGHGGRDKTSAQVS